MAHVALFVGSCILYQLLDTWSRRQLKVNRNEPLLLPVPLRSPRVPPSVANAYHEFRKKQVPWLRSLALLSQWRILNQIDYDGLIGTFYQLYQIHTSVESLKIKANNNDTQQLNDRHATNYATYSNHTQNCNLSQHEYDYFTQLFKTLTQHLQAFQRSILSSHLKYCTYVQHDENKSSSIDQKKMLVARLKKEIEFIVSWASRLKRGVDEWYLTAKYRNLYKR